MIQLFSHLALRHFATSCITSLFKYAKYVRVDVEIATITGASERKTNMKVLTKKRVLNRVKLLSSTGVIQMMKIS